MRSVSAFWKICIVVLSDTVTLSFESLLLECDTSFKLLAKF